MVRQRDIDAFLDDEPMKEEDNDSSSTSGEEEDSEEDEEQFKQRVKELERRREVQKVANAMIRASNSKKGYLGEDEINKLFSKDMRTREAREHRDEIIAEASRQLQVTHGVEIILDEASKRRAYYLREIDPTTFEDPQLSEQVREAIERRQKAKSPEERYKDGLLYRALMYIFMKLRHQVEGEQGEPGVPSKALEDFMTKIGVEKRDYDKYFGPAKAEFVTQGFIKRVLIERDDGDSEEYINWGDRAHAVVDKARILFAFCELYETKVHQWPNHARAAGVDLARIAARRQDG